MGWVFGVKNLGKVEVRGNTIFFDEIPGSLRIFDTQGREVISDTDPLDNSYRIDELARGIYVLFYESAEGRPGSLKFYRP